MRLKIGNYLISGQGLSSRLAGNSKAIDYWFKDRKDAEHEEKK